MVTSDYRSELKGKIVKVASNMFMHKGIKCVKMDDIAHELSISKRTLYEIFQDKETLLYEVLATHEKEGQEELERMNASAVDIMDILYNFYKLFMDNVSKINYSFLDELSRYPSVTKKLEENRRRRSANFEAFAKRGVKEGFFIPGFDYAMIADITYTASEAFRKHEIAKKYGIKKFFITGIAMFIRGLCTEKGLRRIDSIIAKEVDLGK